MKNVLLCLLALTIAFAGYSQNSPSIKGDINSLGPVKGDRVAWEPTKTAPVPSATVNVPESFKNTRDVNIVNVISIGTAANAYSYGYAGGQKSILYSNQDLNMVSHFHRMGGDLDPGGYSGDLGYDVSFDGGMTWTNEIECYTATNTGGGTYYLDAGRYPNHGIYNPPGNTDPMNAYLTYFAPTLDGSNSADAWGGYGYGVARFGDVLDTTKNLDTSIPPYYLYIPEAYDVSSVTSTIVVADANQDWTTGTVAYQGNFIIDRGTWDDGLSDFVFEKSLLDFPTNVENDRPVFEQFAFAPDGTTGWLCVITDNQMVEPLTDLRYYYPVLLKTEDGGQTWGDPIAVRLDGPDGLPGVLNYLTDEQIAEIFAEPLPARDEIPYTTAFDCDVTVDYLGNPHVAVVVGVGGSSEYSIVDYPYSRAAFDISSSDGGTTWRADMLGKINMFRGTFGTDYTEDNRIQITSTADAHQVFISWLDTQLEGATENNAPDIYCRGIYVGDGDWRCFTNDPDGNDMPTNVTTFSEAMWQSYFAIASRFAFEDNGTYTIPFSYEALTTPFDPGLPVQYKYIQDFQFTDADWPIECYIGVAENNNSTDATVSQNYPNPFSQTSTITVNLTEKTNLKLVVTNLVGQKVMEINRGTVPAGLQEFILDGSQLSNGVYFYTVTAGTESVTHKMVVE